MPGRRRRRRAGLELARCCWWRSLVLRGSACARQLAVQPARGGRSSGQDELRLAELAGALDTQRQMNALLSHELRAPLATISAAAQSLDMILAGNGEAVDVWRVSTAR